MSDPYDRTVFRGKVFNLRTRAMLLEVEKMLGYQLDVWQGSYNIGVGASAGTHDGGGAVDLAPANADSKVLAMRRVGFAAWYRPTLSGAWPAHVHAIAIGDAELAPLARVQVNAYHIGRDGLAGNGPDTGPRLTPIPVFNYAAWLAEKDDIVTEQDKKDIAAIVVHELLSTDLTPKRDKEDNTVRGALIHAGNLHKKGR